MKLTETKIKQLPTPDKPVLHSDDATTGLYLKIAVSGRKSFVYRSRKSGKWDVRTLGTWPDFTLDAARKMVMDLNGSSAADTTKTFADLLDEWFDKSIEPHYKVTRNIETYIARGKEWLGTRKLTSLTTKEMVDKLKTYAKTSPVGANRCLSNWKLALDFAVQSGYLDTNPLARTSSKVVGGREKTRDRTLTDDEIRALWASGESQLRFLLLTGLRISEGQHGYRDGSVWRVDDTKNGEPHWVHLPALAVEQITDDWEKSPTAVQSRLKRRGVGWTPHDLRRTFATRLAALNEGDELAPIVVEKMLNHRMQGVMATYNRHDYASKRVEFAEAWAKEVKRIIDSPHCS